ncbi:glucoamylase family protein [Acetobacter sp. AC2005]|uniref:GH36-type glycosyl hydrolase domain-containing protein n=1 Tax=Acetobacter sp. AC2005 TaxID=3134142 RepID=UPI0030D50B4E
MHTEQLSDTGPKSASRSFLRRLFGGHIHINIQDDLFPIKSEIFGIERLEAHAKSLAVAQAVVPAKHNRRGQPLKRRLAENAALLAAANETVTKASQRGRLLPPAAQWLADNYALIDMQIRETSLDLPSGYYTRLPKLANGPFIGLPRVFGITWAFVAHTDSYLQPDFLRRFLLAYQTVTPLTIGELWAVPITLRIVLIENLRRIVSAIIDSHASQQAADILADQLASARKSDAPALSAILSQIDPRIITPAFTAQLAHRSRGIDPEKDPVLIWLEQRLADKKTNIEQGIQEYLQTQGAFNATIRNIITSLRHIAESDWTETFEQVCLVDTVFAEYASFTCADFASRDLYRKAIEDLAYGSTVDEIDIAKKAVSLAQEAASSNTFDQRKNDPGYYLVMEGRSILEASIGFRPSLTRKLAQTFCQSGITGYAVIVFMLALIFLVGPVWLSFQERAWFPWVLLVAVLAFAPALEAAVACINWMALRLTKVTALPGLELLGGIPVKLRTMVVIPALLTNVKTVEELLSRLEVHYLATHDSGVYFALLTDWSDHSEASAPEDAALFQSAAAGIHHLNQKYGSVPDGNRFLLLHRHRVWSESEGVWMGWERKRGKLHELNRLLRGATDTTFLAECCQNIPQAVKYIVTLDADTRLPLETVKKLVGKLAHPLNAPQFNATTGRVQQGYAVLQPRVTPSLPIGHQSTLFQRIFSASSGIDAYSSAISDLYQDMFGEGSYAGKGIYEIDAFEAALAGRVPEATLLSHDLFEGIFARAGLASDIEVIEEFPTDYLVAAQRLHRWTRGDWQLLPWIVSGIFRTPSPRDSLSGIARWKMVDNLRRTLCAPFTLLALIISWILLPENAGIWTLFILLIMAVPAFLPVIPDIAPRREWISFRSYFNVLGASISNAVVMTALNITFLVHQACLLGDAIIRTLGRVFVTRRYLLQWVPAAQTADLLQSGLLQYYLKMLSAPLIAVILVIQVTMQDVENLIFIGPLTVLWAFSPAIGLWTSRVAVLTAQSRPSRTDIRTLRLTARNTWRFFEEFVTADDHMLPPDNFQEVPSPVVARRTSPTNIGLYLLCTVSAYDFGWNGLADTIERLENTFKTLDALEKHKGHLYNWYSTADLEPLAPLYVSTVDSGNFAGHLVALARVCREWTLNSAQPSMWREGIADAITLAITDLTFRNGERLQNTKQQKVLVRSLARLKTSVLSASEIKTEASLLSLLKQAQTIAEHASHLYAEPTAAEEQTAADPLFWCLAPLKAIESHLRDLDHAQGTTFEARLKELQTKATMLAYGMDFAFLRDPARKLLSIGFVVTEDTPDSNCYDLLASESRLAVFFAIAKGDIPARDWFRLGRALTSAGSGAALVSWSGSMFEYLMPSLVMRAPIGSLLQQTNALIVQRQIAYGQSHNIPWGISESAYNVRDVDYTYQYSNFGIPGLGLKRGLGQDRVVAPYATLLASMVDPQKAVANLSVLEKTGAHGRYGFYEALDYTPERVPDGQKMAIVQAYMAHHQGMSILSVADAVLDGIMRKRFHDDPVIASAELLLQERAPRTGAVAHPLPIEEYPLPRSELPQATSGRYYGTDYTPVPFTHLLSNGRYTVMLTAAGSGYTMWQGLAVTRWREDPTLDNFGSYLYLKNVKTGKVWSAGIQPCGEEPDDYVSVFHEDRAEFTRRDGALTTTVEVMVSAEDDADVRYLTVFNGGYENVEIDITSYAELALLAPDADLAHPAFTKLFVETDYLPEAKALMATRRRRTPDEPEIWAAHVAVCATSITVETNRAQFVGRGRTLQSPAALAGETELSGQTGTVLDPCFAMRSRVSIKPGATARITFWTMVASSRQELERLIEVHQDDTALDRARTLAWTQAQIQFRHFDITPAEADLFQRLAGHILFANAALRAPSAVIMQGMAAQPILWEQGISGDLPLVVLRVKDTPDTDIIRQVLLAHEYLRLKQVAVDLVLMNEHPSSYLQDLQNTLENLVRSMPKTATVAGSISILRADLISTPVKNLLLAAARVVLSADKGLAEQLDQADVAVAPKSVLFQTPHVFAPSAFKVPDIPELEFFNGHGGFAKNGQEYVVVLASGRTTPAPWINVIANDTAGFQASAEGSGYTWALNSREHQITPWSNDPVSNQPGEIFYLRDEDTKVLWSPTATIRRDIEATYVCRHGRGYTRYDRIAHGIGSTLLQYAPVKDPIKISRLQLHNLSGHARTLSLTGYVEWVLGTARSKTAPFITTQIDEATGALFARNQWSAVYGGRVAFADIGGYVTASSGDRTSFVGRNGTLNSPYALTLADTVQGSTGAGLDPCGVLQTIVTLPADGRVEIVFLLGEAENEGEARRIIAHYRTVDLDTVLDEVKQQWNSICGSVQVKTPDRSMDIMLNGWLLYQTLSSRVRARAGFYQASGAYGFRDQLQDGMALAASCPALVREHLVRAASRQFVEGDVQHWWLPQTGAGVRTHISDDCTWLGYTVAHYVTTTGDLAVLDENIGFLEAPPLPITEHDNFMVPAHSAESATLFEHCARALDRSLAVGVHGLPLMGTGDWNDGMNRVGEQGRGESVWLGWFLYTTLEIFIPIARARNEDMRADKWQQHTRKLAKALEHTWDGDWYLRAYFDDGTPLGSHTMPECQIDAISQSWSVLSGAAMPERANHAMRSAIHRLVRQQDGLILVLTPPFDKAMPDPGYIRGYPPGIRENGGQYTHAALWTVMAIAALGDGNLAQTLFHMLNPITHSQTQEQAARYKLEPYVIAADVYSEAPHVGRGGWSWYTGSAGWMQRVGTETILGVRIHADKLLIDPCIPQHWPEFEVTLQWKTARYSILVKNPDHVCRGVRKITVDGLQSYMMHEVNMQDDGLLHKVEVILGS